MTTKNIAYDMGIDMKNNKKIVVLNILFLIFSACGGANDTTTESSEISTTTSSTTTLAESSSGEIYNEAELVVPPILLKPLIGATGILTSNSEETGK